MYAGDVRKVHLLSLHKNMQNIRNIIRNGAGTIFPED